MGGKLRGEVRGTGQWRQQTSSNSLPEFSEVTVN